jgi:small subunit ribosomal protein S4
MEAKLLLARLVRLGMLPEVATSLDDVLGLNVEDLLKRRLQTLLFTRGVAHTANQARQWITHGHVSVGGRRVTIPGLLVPRHLEQTISFANRSPLSSDMHPARKREEEEIRMPPAEEPKVEEAKEEQPAEAAAPEATAPEPKQ